MPALRRALIVANSPELRRRLVEILAHYSFDRLLEADSGCHALELIRHQEILLVVMTTDLPDLDGITVAEKIGTERPAPIVLLTDSAETAIIERARHAGVMNVVVGPVLAGQLLAAADLAIHQFVELTSLRDEVCKLRLTLETRKLLDRAKGVLMKQGMDEPGAFRRLQKLAMDNRKSLREVAEAVLLTAE